MMVKQKQVKLAADEVFPSLQVLTASSMIAVAAEQAIQTLTISSSAAITLTGQPTLQIFGISDRQVVRLVNIGSFAITLPNLATQAFSFVFAGANVVIPSGRVLELLYSSTIGGWIPLTDWSTPGLPGGAIISFLATASKTFDFASIAGGAESTTTITVPGAQIGDLVLCKGAVPLLPALTWDAEVTAANTVTLRARNNGSALAPQDPPSQTYRVLVLRAS